MYPKPAPLNFVSLETLSPSELCLRSFRSVMSVSTQPPPAACTHALDPGLNPPSTPFGVRAHGLRAGGSAPALSEPVCAAAAAGRGKTHRRPPPEHTRRPGPPSTPLAPGLRAGRGRLAVLTRAGANLQHQQGGWGLGWTEDDCRRPEIIAAAGTIRVFGVPICLPRC